MLNVIFYTPQKTRSTSRGYYDLNGDYVVETTTEHYHSPRDYACETMTSGDFLFENDKDMPLFEGSMKSLCNARCMFNGSVITSVSHNDGKSDFSSLTNAEAMFANCLVLESVKISMPSIKNATGMFANTPILTTIEVDGIESVENGESMFQSCGITTSSYNFNNLINGNRLFYNSNLTSFSGCLSNVTNLDEAFVKEEDNATIFSEFETTDLDNLQSAQSCFKNGSLTKWNYGLPSLQNGDEMFSGCPLTSFVGDLSSLTSGNGMFSGCLLDSQSVMYIVDSLPSYTQGEHSITIGINCSSNLTNLNKFAQDAEFISWDILNTTISNKGWTATWTNNEGNVIEI